LAEDAVVVLVTGGGDGGQHLDPEGLEVLPEVTDRQER
jgi:hypothetical protein